MPINRSMRVLLALKHRGRGPRGREFGIVEKEQLVLSFSSSLPLFVFSRSCKHKRDATLHSSHLCFKNKNISSLIYKVSEFATTTVD